jgi:hypothetical protein
VLAGRGNEANEGEEYRDPAADEEREAVSPRCASLSRAIDGRGPAECR